jgi:hypothetical protein
VGASVGPRGAKMSVNTRGQVRRTVGVPGTGLSHVTQTRLKSSEDVTASPLDELTDDDLAYVKGRHLRKLVGWGSALVIVVLILAGAPTVAGYLIIPAVVATVAAPLIARRVWP